MMFIKEHVGGDKQKRKKKKSAFANMPNVQIQFILSSSCTYIIVLSGPSLFVCKFYVTKWFFIQ